MNRRLVFEVIQKGDEAGLRSILEAGIDLNMRSSQRSRELYNFTPLHFAVYKGRLRAVQLLIAAQADPNLYDNTETEPHSTALHWAFIHPNRLVQTLIVQELLDGGADANALCYHPDFNGQTPLMMAATDSTGAVVRFLIAAGARLNQQDPGGWTALHFAAFNHNIETLRALLLAGANPGLRDEKGLRPDELARAEEVKALYRELEIKV